MKYKKYIPYLCFLFVLISNGIVKSQTKGYIGLFTDENRSGWCVSSELPYYFCDIWLWCKPDPNYGAICVEFKIIGTGNINNPYETHWNDIVCVTLGDILQSISVCYGDLQYDWHWICHMNVFVHESHDGYYSISYHNDNQYDYIALFGSGCEESPCVYPAVPLTNFYINYSPDDCPPMEVRSASWGAIKELFK